MPNLGSLELRGGSNPAEGNLFINNFPVCEVTTVTAIDINMNVAENQSIGVIITTTEQVGKKYFQMSVHQVYILSPG